MPSDVSNIRFRPTSVTEARGPAHPDKGVVGAVEGELVHGLLLGPSFSRISLLKTAARPSTSSR